MKQKKKKVVLAFSGGLDTSFCAKYLSEDLGYEVHTAIANTGGFSDAELEEIRRRALRLGAASHAALDVTADYYNKSIRYMIAGNVLRGGTYPISVSSERIFQAMAIIDYAKSIGADAVAHGSTGAGNDQVRFDLTFQIMAPGIEIITPTRDMTRIRDRLSEASRLRSRIQEDGILHQQRSLGHEHRRQGNAQIGADAARLRLSQPSHRDRAAFAENHF